MRWLKRDLWKAGVTIAGMLLLLVLMMWIVISAADAYEGISGLTAPVMISLQATPTEDATVTALNKEKLAQEVQQLNNQNEPVIPLAGSVQMHLFSSQRSLWSLVPSLAFGVGAWIDEMHKIKS